MADKTQNVKTRLSFDGEAEYKAACKEINSTLKVLLSRSARAGKSQKSSYKRVYRAGRDTQDTPTVITYERK